MAFLIREATTRPRQVYSISVYTDGMIRHSPIYRDGDDLMLMTLSFTGLVELVDYFTRKSIFRKLCLQKPAKLYAEFIKERSQYEAAGINQRIISFKQLNSEISLKVKALRLCEFSLLSFS